MNKYGSAALIFFLLLFIDAADAQSKHYKVGRVKCDRAAIINPGEFYGEYELEPRDRETLAALKFSDKEADTINYLCKEQTWPQLMSELVVRLGNPEKVKSYVVYVVAMFDEKYLLVAPVKYNQNMGDGWAPPQDIYFVVGTSGVIIL